MTTLTCDHQHWIDQNYQIDRYGLALMMIREGCSDPAGLARRILAEFETLSPAPAGHEICSACNRVFKFGDVCTRGGCPCGGDV